MQAWEIQHDRTEAMVLLDEGQVPAARQKLDGLIAQLQSSATPQLRLALANCLTDRATVLRFANEWDGALADLTLAQSKAEDLLALMRRPVLTSVHLVRAKILSTRGAPVFDAPSAQRELEAVKALGGNGWMVEELESHVSFQMRDWERAASMALQAARELEADGWPRGAAACRRRAGEAFLELGRLADSEGQLEQARGFFERRGPLDMLSETRLTLARLESRRGSHDNAWILVLQALAEMESRLRRFRDVREQQLFVFDKLRFYDHAFDIGLATPGDAGCVRAWNVAERAKSFYLAQLLANADVPLFDGVSPELVRELEEAESRLDEVERRLSRLSAADRGGTKEADLEGRLTALSAQRSAKLARAMQENPRWLALRNPSPFDAKVFLRRLPHPWVPLSYFWRDDGERVSLHIFTTDAQRRPLHESVPWSRNELQALERTAEELRGKVDLLSSIFPGALAESVLPSWLRKRLPADARLLISPHGLLRGLPLHALKIDDKFAGELWPIQYTPGFGLAAASPKKAATQSALLVGCVQDGFGDRPLAGVETEIADLATLWRQASRDTVTKLVPQDGTLAAAGWPASRWGRFEVLHFACHGVFREERPFDAALRIGSEAIRGSELFAVKLNARIVTLSACALGRHARRWGDAEMAGEEWIGLYLPLFYAGARTVVVSLWDADSRTAGEFMTALHGSLAQGSEPAIAFHAAVLAVKGKLAPLWTNWCLVGFPELTPEVT
jgi:CHAT domain-containing protein